MKDEKPKRKRIINPTSQPIKDPEAYIRNSSSDNARHIKTFSEYIETEFWIDKHYTNRQLFGDKNGKREGIELELIQELIKKAYRYLIYFSSKHKEFLFINHPPQRPRNIRIVLRQIIKDQSALNVVVEYHFVNLVSVEITVKTAMCIDNFDLGDGQYALEFDGNECNLYILKKGNLNLVDRYVG